MKYPILLALAAAPVPAIAQDEEDHVDIHPLPKPSREIVVTATGERLAIEKTGQAIAVFERTDIEREQQLAVADLLRIAPGVSVTRNGGLGGFSAVRIRGAEDTHTLVLFDGVRLNDPSSPGGGFDFGNLLTGSIERIELLRGPNSVPWGSQAIGGVVNITTARRDANGRAEYGYRNAANIVAQVGPSFGPVFLNIGGGYFSDDGISAFRSGSERDGFRHFAGNVRAEIDVSRRLSLDLRTYYSHGRNQIDGSPPPTFVFADTPQFSETQQLTAYVGATLLMFDDELKHRLAFTLSDVNRDNYDAPEQAAPSFLARGRTERYEYRGDLNLFNRAPSANLRLIFGAEHERSRFSDGVKPVGTHVSSGYLQAVLEPVEHLTLTAGTRIDDHRDYGTEPTFSANLAWRPADGTILRAAFGEGFKAPTLFQLFSFFGNAALEPERARSYELGIEQKLFDYRLRLAATVFRRDISDQIDFISCFGQSTGICTNRPFGTYDNIARTRTRGVELDLLARPTDALRIAATYSLVRARNRDTGLALTRRPRHLANLSADWGERGKLQIGATLNLVSGSFDTDFQTFARTRLDGYALVGLRASYPLSTKVELYGRVDNLLDENYQTVSGYGTYGRNAHAGIRAYF